MEEGEKEDTTVDPVGVGVGEDQEPLEAEAIAPEIGPHPGAEGRGHLDGIERLPLHRKHGLEAGIADAGHGQSRRFSLDDKQLCPRSRAMDLAVDKLDRTVVEGF
jgi:hypothetical protein